MYVGGETDLGNDSCTVCGFGLRQDQLFCPKCGTPRPDEEQNVCVFCGFGLRKDQDFCPKCGQRQGVYSPSLAAIDEYNSNVEQKKKAKKRRGRILAAALIGAVLLIAAVSFGSAAFARQGQAVVDLVKAGDCAKAAQEYESLSSSAAKKWRDEIIEALVDQVEANECLPEDAETYLITPAVMEQYAGYQQLAQALEISSSDGTNVAEYIDVALQLRPYLKYNEIYACFSTSYDFYAQGNGKIDDVIDAYEYYEALEALNDANSYYQSALRAALEYDESEYLVAEYQNALRDLVASTASEEDFDGYFSTKGNAAYTAINGMIDDFQGAVDEMIAIYEALPVLQ